jgi:succinate dehydrogenase hydrophobic anchor subunit
MLWLLQAISGLALGALLGLHMIANHFIVEGGLRTYKDVLYYLSNPTIFVLEVIFLLVVVPHAFLGLRAILLDLGPKPRIQRIMDIILGAMGIATLVYGIALFVTLQGRI